MVRSGLSSAAGDDLHQPTIIGNEYNVVSEAEAITAHAAQAELALA